jgi:outer membrane protein, heavy metal efflux system
MRRTRLFWILLLLMGQTRFSVLADPPAQLPDSVSGESAQGGVTAQVAPRRQPPSFFEQKQIGERLRRPAQGAKAQDTTKTPIPSPRQPRNQYSLPELPRTTNVAKPRTSTTRYDAPVRRVQTTASDMTAPIVPGTPPLPVQRDTLTPLSTASVGGQSISLQTALYGAITSNPDLVTLRQGNALAASAEAVEVARHFPTTLNPTLWIDYRPITLVPKGTFGTSPPVSKDNSGFYHYGQNYIYISLRQPIELGHQTSHRYHIAEAAFNQQQWVVVQAELMALVQTYRFFQTAAYRREKYRLSDELADFNERLSESLQKRMEANQVQAADVALARVESRATRQLVKAARQDYLTALTDLRNQIGIPEQAGAVEPLGEFTLPPYIPPVDEQVMIQEALQSRPDIHAALAQVNGTYAAVKLAKGDRIPTPVIGPQYEMDEAGVQYIGFVFISPLPIWNNGKPLVLQREAEHRRAIVAHQQAQQRAIAQVRAAVAKWNGATELVNESAGLSKELDKEVNVLDRLFEAGQADLTKLMQARQRLIQLENAQLDAVWQATQAQADLLLALGMPSLIHAMLSRAENDAVPKPSTASPAPASAPSPVATMHNGVPTQGVSSARR